MMQFLRKSSLVLHSMSMYSGNGEMSLCITGVVGFSKGGGHF
jgi:hypothetical protein